MRRIRSCYKRNRRMWGLAFPHESRIEIDPALDDKTLRDIAGSARPGISGCSNPSTQPSSR